MDSGATEGSGADDDEQGRMNRIESKSRMMSDIKQRRRDYEQHVTEAIGVRRGLLGAE